MLLQVLPEQYNFLAYSDESYVDRKLRIASSELIGDKADRHFFTCGEEADYVVDYDGAIDGGSASVFKTNQTCVFQNLKITGTFMISSSAEFSLSGMVYSNYQNIANAILDLQM